LKLGRCYCVFQVTNVKPLRHRNRPKRLSTDLRERTSPFLKTGGRDGSYRCQEHRKRSDIAGRLAIAIRFRSGPRV
jgi:hypothetical protein